MREKSCVKLTFYNCVNKKIFYHILPSSWGWDSSWEGREDLPLKKPTKICSAKKGGNKSH